MSVCLSIYTSDWYRGNGVGSVCLSVCLSVYVLWLHKCSVGGGISVGVSSAEFYCSNVTLL